MVTDPIYLPYVFILNTELKCEMCIFTEKRNTKAEDMFYQLVNNEFTKDKKDKIVFNINECDLQKLKLGQSKKQIFSFKIFSDKIITIKKIDISFDCVDVQWDKSPILPDQQSNIFVRFDAKETGDFIRIIKLYFDQGDVVELKIEG